MLLHCARPSLGRGAREALAQAIAKAIGAEIGAAPKRACGSRPSWSNSWDEDSANVRDRAERIGPDRMHDLYIELAKGSELRPNLLLEYCKKPRDIWSEWQDLNLRPPRPERCVLLLSRCKN